MKVTGWVRVKWEHERGTAHYEPNSRTNYAETYSSSRYNQDKFIDILTSFGDLQESVNVALQRYTIEQITTKINELRRKDEEYESRYRLDYPAFAKRMSEDVDFVQQVESQISKVWEVDLADWEFCHKGIEDWTRKLQDILLK